MRYAAMGMNGMKNCLVIGRTSEARSNVATAVLTRGPGDSIMDKEKMPKKARSNQCPSYIVHLCACKDLRVSNGENDVCNAVIEDAGDCRFRSFERSFRRSL